MATSTAAATAIGWYGPLIDLADAPKHVDQFVQLIAVVQSSLPIQRSSGEGILKTKILVGDGTRTYFAVSVWPKNLGNAVDVGDIVFLQNVKIVKFRDILEATTLQVSTLLILAHSNVLNNSRVDDFILNAKLGDTARQKLKKVVDWVKRTESALIHVPQEKFCRKKLKNWKEDEEKLNSCSSISKILALSCVCNVKFYASIDEVLFPVWKYDGIKEHLLFNQKHGKTADMIELEDLICEGCKNCGCPNRNQTEENKISLYCRKSSSYVHSFGPIYRPFILQAWDHTGKIPVLVMNKAAEILFGYIVAENVYGSCQKGRSTHFVQDQSCKPHKGCKGKKSLNLYYIWLIVIKMLLKQGQNSPFCFEITVNPEKNVESGRFELISFTMPCTKK